MTEPQRLPLGELRIVAAALSVAVAAHAGWHLAGLPTVVLVVALLCAAMTAARSRPHLLLLCAVLLVVGYRSSAAVSALNVPLPDTVTGTARLITDPTVRSFDSQAIVQIDGRRYQAQVPLDEAGEFRSLLAGEMVRIEGEPAPIQGAPRGWVMSWHLAGRLKVTSADAVPGTAIWYRAANSVRRTIERGAREISGDRGPLYMGLVVGDDRGQSELLKFRFRASGLTHLLAVSGQNVAFLLSIADPVLSRTGPRSKLLTAAIVLAFFTLVTRGEPSVLRAVVMAAVAMLAVTSGRAASGVRVLALTVICLTLVDPLIVHSMGFRLSVAATLGLLVLARPIEERLPGPGFLRLPLAVTLAAQAATAPLILTMSSGVPMAATPANLLAVPAAGLVMMLGLTVGVFAGLVRNPVAHVATVPTEILVYWIDKVAEVCSRMPLAVLGVVELFVALAAVSLVLERARGRTGRVGTVCGVVCLVVLCIPRPAPSGSFEVAEGATLWIGTCGGSVLVLNGPSRLDEVLEGLWGRNVRRVDVVVVDGGRAVARLVGPLREQLQFRRAVSTSTAAPEGVTPLAGGGIRVGDLLVHRGADPASGTGRAQPGTTSRAGTDGDGSPHQTRRPALVGSVGGACKF